MAEKFEQPEQPGADTKKETEPDKKKSGMGLYDVKQTEEGFEVNMPGLLDNERRLIVGTSKKSFETMEQVQQAIERTKESVKEQFERASLEKTFSKHFFRIDETPEGNFRVLLPGLVDTKTGNYVGTTYKEFDSWKAAKEYFLEKKEDEEKLTRKPLLEVQTSENEKIAFEELDAFNPRVAPSKEAHEIPDSIKKFLMGEGRLDGNEASASTYKNTVKEKGWEKKLYSFVSGYLQEGGADIAKELKIEHLDALTPKQAVELATRVVIDLTKYKTSDTKKEEKSEADGKTVLQLLQEGQRKKDNSDWEGNGVCRNFASSVKAVFESLKENQTQYSQLRDTYCLYERGTETFAPKREDKNSLQMDKGGHAWNTFVTISREGSANAVIIDTTWAKRNLDTKEVEGLDYTLTRMEPVVNAIGKELKAETPDKEEQLKHILFFYMLKMEKPGKTGGFVSPEEEKQFYASRALELMTKQGVPQELPKPLVKIIGQEYHKIAESADRSEIETIYKIYQSNPELDFRGILRNYLKGKELSDYHASSLIFVDDNLQREVFEQLKSSKGFEEFIKQSSKFRVRTREAIPELFFDFSPETKPEDAMELKHLLRESQMLSRYEHTVDPKNLSGEKISGVFEKARQSLRVLNPERYDEMVAGLDNYKIIKRYDKLYRELKK
jgi:hypothetical protein